MGYHLRQLLLVFSHHLGALLMGLGALLVTIGLAVRLAREYQVTRAESALSAPAFEEVLVRRIDGPSQQGPAAPSAVGRWILPAPTWPAVTPVATGTPSLHLVDAPAFDGERLPSPQWLPGGQPRPRTLARQIADASLVATPTTRRVARAFATSVQGAAANQVAGTEPVVWDPAAATETPDSLRGQAGVPTRLVIPSIGLDTPVVVVGWEARVVNGEFVGNQWQTADGAAGYHRTSALPGHVGNTVISGHNNIGGAVFKDLHRLKLGDRIILHTRDRQLDYVVAANFIVEEAGVPIEQRRANAKWIGPTADVRLTLITCFPPWGNSHRTIVVAIPASAATQAAP